jgi:hypothetical protein
MSSLWTQPSRVVVSEGKGDNGWNTKKSVVVKFPDAKELFRQIHSRFCGCHQPCRQSVAAHHVEDASGTHVPGETPMKSYRLRPGGQMHDIDTVKKTIGIELNELNEGTSGFWMLSYIHSYEVYTDM